MVTSSIGRYKKTEREIEKGNLIGHYDISTSRVDSNMRRVPINSSTLRCYLTFRGRICRTEKGYIHTQKKKKKRRFHLDDGSDELMLIEPWKFQHPTSPCAARCDAVEPKKKKSLTLTLSKPYTLSAALDCLGGGRRITLNTNCRPPPPQEQISLSITEYRWRKK